MHTAAMNASASSTSMPRVRRSKKVSIIGKARRARQHHAAWMRGGFYPGDAGRPRGPRSVLGADRLLELDARGDELLDALLHLLADLLVLGDVLDDQDHADDVPVQ